MRLGVEVDPPGAAAPRRPTRSQRQAVQAVLRQNIVDLAKLDAYEMRALLPVFQQAQQDMSLHLKDWMHRAPNGQLRWSAWKYQGAIVQLRGGVEHLELALHGRLSDGGTAAQKLALEHMVHETARFSDIFGAPAPPLRLNMARLIATGKASLVPKYASSAARYAWNSRFGVWHDINRRLAVDILNGTPVYKTIERLIADGGPRGMVAVRGIAGEEGAVVEYIPEGLFKRYKSRAETYVRTEVASAYGLQMSEGLFAARQILPDLQRRWCTDGSGCPRICQPMDGQVVALEEPFIDGMGGTVDDQPAHPRCRCRVGPWRAHWGQLLDSLGLN